MENNKTNFIFFGTSHFSVIILEELKNAGIIPSIIITAPDKPKGRGMKMTPPEVKMWADKNNIKTLQPISLVTELPSLLGNSVTKSKKPDLFVVASYGKIIPKEVLDIPKHGTLNVHPSLLPKLRGASPIKTAILNDEKDSVGVTIILLDKKMDHGPILDQKVIEVKDLPTQIKWPLKATELENLLAHEGGKLLAESIPAWINGNIDPQEQDHTKATFSQKIEKKDAEINLNDDPYKNFLKIQAFDDNPRPYFLSPSADGSKRFIITEAKYENGELKILRVIPEGKKEIYYQN